MENKRTLVVALGGNALLKRGEPLEADIQRKNIELAARTIAQLTRQWRVVLVHGNGPQVGLLALQNSAYANVTPYPLDILGAESRGMIGYMLQQALKNHLPEREISVLLTQSKSMPTTRHSSIQPNISAPFTTKRKPVRYRQKRAGYSKPTVTPSAALCPPRSRNALWKTMPSAR